MYIYIYMFFLPQMMSILMNTVIFEDCRNLWSVSRPLLGLILLNEKVSILELELLVRLNIALRKSPRITTQVRWQL